MLKRILDALMLDKNLLPKNGETYCNIFVDRVSKVFGFNSFSGLMANQIVDYCNKHFKKVLSEEAVDLAKLNRVVIVGQKALGHGHVAIVYPVDMEYSPSWDKRCPMIANVGKSNGIMRVSQAFKTEPEYFMMPEWEINK